MGIESAYRKSIETLFLWVSREVDSSQTVIFRTYAPAHYRLVSMAFFFSFSQLFVKPCLVSEIQNW